MIKVRNHLCDAGASVSSKICADIIQDEMNGIDISGKIFTSIEGLSADIRRAAAVRQK